MTHTSAALLLGTALFAAQPAEQLPAGAKVVKVEAVPARIVIDNPYRYGQLVLTAVLDNGERIDATRLATVTAPECVTVGTTRLVRPKADGKGELKATVAGQSVTIPVEVSGQKEKVEVSFIQDVMPTLSRIGCNAGTCHGSADGKNGFKLSLRGYDPLLDHRSLTDDLEGRRFNRAAPAQSLMLLKTTGGVAHVGGVVTQPGEPYYELLKAWIAAGVPFDPKSPRVTSLEVRPKSFVVGLPGQKQQLALVATYSDGKTRDVTAEAFVESSNTEVATVDRGATVTAVRRGEATMLARYEGSYAAATMVCMGDRSGFVWKDPPAYNYVDTLVYEKLKQVKVLPSDVCTDAEFVRRVYLDLTGLPPDPSVVRGFLLDNRPSRQKRDEMVDQLVGSSEYVEHWTNKWADLLQVNRKFLGEPGAKSFREYIRKAVNDNTPYDKFVYNILTGSGANIDNPAASYYKVLRDPASAMENTTQLFLAVRFNCNKCHDHPFERWTQDQYYHLAAYFAQVGRAEDPRYKGQKVGGSAVEGAQPLVEIISDKKDGEVKHERTGQVSKPLFPYTHPDAAPDTATRREQLARWVASRENQYFAKSYVNRVWAYLLGVGIIEPVDDIRAGNPPSNPKLLDKLTEDFVAHGFDVRHLVKTICKSRAYQHSVVANEWNKDDEINYARALPRRLPAEVLFDAIHRAAGSQSKLPGLPPGSRAAQLLDSRDDVGGGFFQLFGKPPRESACECERSGTLMLGPVLNLVNGPVLADAVKDPSNRISKLLKDHKDDARVVEELYLAALSRMPTARELDLGVQAMKEGEADFDGFVAEYKRRMDALQTYEKGMPQRQLAWEGQYRNVPTWQAVEFESAESRGKATFAKQEDGSILVSGPNPDKNVYTVKLKTNLAKITALRLEALRDNGLPGKGPGRAANGNFVLLEFQATFKADHDEDQEEAKVVPVALVNGVADFSQAGFEVGSAIDNNPATGWAIVPQTGKSHTAYFHVKDPAAFTREGTLTLTMIQNFGGQHTIGKFRVSVTTAKPPLSLVPPPEAVAKLLALDPEKRTAEDKAKLTEFYRGQDQELKRLLRAVADHGEPFDKRQPGAQDLLWALLTSKRFLFNH